MLGVLPLQSLVVALHVGHFRSQRVELPLVLRRHLLARQLHLLDVTSQLTHLQAREASEIRQLTSRRTSQTGNHMHLLKSGADLYDHVTVSNGASHKHSRLAFSKILF